MEHYIPIELQEPSKIFFKEFDEAEYLQLPKAYRKQWTREHARQNQSFYIGKYIRREYGSDLLFESSLSRIYHHFTDNGFIIGSAFRPIVDDPVERKKICGVESHEENLQRHKDLLGWLHSHRLGFIIVDGVWIDSRTKQHYPELSVFVPYIGLKEMTYEKFLEIAQDWAKKYCQDAVLVKDPDPTVDYHKLFLLDKHGVVKKLKGVYKPDQISQIYTQFKSGKHAGKTFVFEGVQTYGMFYNKQILNEQGYIFY